jgi:glucose/arabinose dehydrogenase
MTSITKRSALLAALAALAALLLIPAATARAGTVPPGFQETAVFSGLDEPTSLAFSPDGRVFVAEKSGLIKVFNSSSDPTPDVFADLTPQVYNYWDRGLLGMALDPDFPADPHVYVLYTLDAKPGGAVPAWGGKALGDPCPSPPGPTADGCVATGRLSRLTASGNTMTAETPLITDWCQQFPSHSVGDLAFGADGSLYVSGGEGASFNFEDWGQSGNPVNPCGDPPGGVGGAMTPPGAEGGSLRAQDVRTPADPTGLSGALLRIDPASGQGSAGNPFAASLDANARRILSFGLRNPFRFAIRPGSNEVWLGDVGSGHWEEINRVDPAAATASNFGWPCYEGENGSSKRNFSWDSENVSLCETLYGEGAAAVAAPYFAYDHADKVVAGESCATGSSSIAGLAFYEGGPFPNAYNGALFFADYSRNCIWAMLPGSNGLPDPTKIQTFDAGAEGPDSLEVGPDGALWFTDLNTGTVWRIGHSDGNQPPTAVATATPSGGPPPLNVQLSAADSSDPDPSDTLSYAWDLDEDDEFDDSTQVSPSRLYSTKGAKVASVRVSDPDGASDTDSVTIQVGTTPPTATLLAPASSLTWEVDEPIAFAATGSDAEDGSLPPSAFKWRLYVHHCPSNCHVHQIETKTGLSEGFFVAPDHEYPSWLEIELTVTDSDGLTDTESVNVLPETVSVRLQSLPAPGFDLAFDGGSVTTPDTEKVIKGSNNTVAAPGQTLGGVPYAFGAWSDGGAASHNFTADSDVTLTALFGTPPPPTIAAISPRSPSSDESPVVKGTLGSDFPAVIKLYANPTCSGTPVASAAAAQFSATGIAVPVAVDATTRISAAAANAAGDSACSDAIAYTEDSTPPARPELTLRSQPSPANENEPRIVGGAEAGTTVRLYAADGCRGEVAMALPATEFAGGRSVRVADDSSTAFTAAAVDAAGNLSPCSRALTYVEDSTAPRTSILSGPSARRSRPIGPRRRGQRRFRARFAFEAEGAIAFHCRFNSGPFKPCASPVTWGNLKPGPHRFWVYAVDLAGNADTTPAVRRFKLTAPQRRR